MGESMTSVATSVGEPLAPTSKDFAVDGTTLGSGPLDPSGMAPALPSAGDEAGFSERRVAMVDARGLGAMGELAEAMSYLWVRLDAPGPQHRGRLGLYIEEAIEQKLEKRGALSPGIQASTGLDASLSDQLYRARFVEMRGIALGIPSLEGITNLGRSLDAEDSAVLRWWIAAAADRPVHLVISNENTKLRVYPSPVLFESLFEVAPEPVTPLPPSPSMAASSESMDLSDLPPEVEETNVWATQIVPIEERHPADGPAQDRYHRDDGAADVDLPELDRALGLTPEKGPVQNARQIQKNANLRTSDSPQLPLEYESPIPPLANTQKDGTPTGLETWASAPSSPETGTGVERKDTSATPASPVEQREYVPLLAAEEAPNDDLAELDEDEFLKTLEEDSARAPHVQAEEQGSRRRDAENSPPALPTKTIARSPFIRLANPVEAISDSGEEESGSDRESGGSTISRGNSAPSPNVKVSPARDPLNVTLAGAAAPDPNAYELLNVTLKGAAAPDPNERDPLNATLAGAAAPDPNDPFNQLAAREWKMWVTNLEAARGPKPLSVIERMFVTDYTRLREAVRRGVAAQSANEILDEWQSSFSKSYSQAFEALRSRGKRPTMVLDIVEMAARLGRLQGAKRVQLLMVDGLRFDLGLMVQDRMRQTADASLAERLLLWSALPSVTQYQLELLGKGPDGLKEPGKSDEPPALVARGAAARVPRRVRTGRIELFKLDVVEDCLREVGLPVLDRMDSIADQTTAALTEHLSKQPPRTMVVAFGDHGFALDPKKAGTTEEVLQGGSSPEEVLVPAFAWLTGAVH